MNKMTDEMLKEQQIQMASTSTEILDTFLSRQGHELSTKTLEMVNTLYGQMFGHGAVAGIKLMTSKAIEDISR